MEIKAKLNQPYEEEQRMDFIVQNNHTFGYEIRETDVALEAWGYTDEEILNTAKENKLKEASDKAFDFRDKTGVIAFEARPVDISLLKNGEKTIELHTEILNQNDFFQLMMAFQMGVYVGDKR